MKFGLIIAVCLSGVTGLAATNANETVSVAHSITNGPMARVVQRATTRCEATTLSGNRCKRNAVQGAQYCSQHAAIVRRRGKKDSR